MAQLSSHPACRSFCRSGLGNAVAAAIDSPLAGRAAAIVSFDLPPPEAVADERFVQVKMHVLEVFRRELLR